MCAVFFDFFPNYYLSTSFFLPSSPLHEYHPSSCLVLSAFRARPRFLGRQSGRLPALWKVTIRQVRLFRSLSRHLCSASKHHRKGLHRWICEAVDLWGTGTPQGTSLLNPKTSPRVFPSESSSDRPQGDDDGEDDGLLRCPTSQGGLLHAINRLSRPWLP